MIHTWQAWLKFSKKVVGIQASIFFGLIFLVIVTPLSYFLRIVAPAIFKGSNSREEKKTHWHKIRKTNYDLDFARRQ